MHMLICVYKFKYVYVYISPSVCVYIYTYLKLDIARFALHVSFQFFSVIILVSLNVVCK